MAKIPHRIYLSEEQMPKQWYNLRADMKELPEPVLNPQTFKPATVEDLYPVFCEKLAQQELDDKTHYIDIPEEVQEFYKMYRPSPLIRAYNLEKYLDTPAKIYFKFEGNNTSGSHKLNSAIAQAYYAKEQGLTSLTTETGAGQWGTALSEACAYYNIPLTVFMVKCSYEQKPFRRAVIETFDAMIHPSPSTNTAAGRAILEANPNTTGSLGCAISEAVEKAVTTEGCKYVLGSVLNQVLLHQSIIGEECKIAMEMFDEYPDVIVGCAGGGSNLGGLIAPFMRDKLTGKANPRMVAVEPASCPSLTRGRYAYDFCDTGKITPLAKMYTLGCEYVPSANHAGGLRYHGMSPILSKLYHDGYMEAISVEQTKVFEAAVLFAKQETILPAPESAHAILGAIQEAQKCKETGEAKTILFGLTGTGYFDMTAYDSYRSGKMSDYIPTDEDLQKGFHGLPKIPGIQE
ncbi:TrpB-like pyridoxal phosphate-dependent enzyme [Anaeromicropila populeti]|uniref:tryptophan synthase n=1 Tax=Anaeromicropila populeti TaxID=37658 RepID=A0A1I6LCK8_9FIRM|nr:TrpB-like pyridoxal phosphate-dependent enzyme [Anaeromicropila populeti]SFS01183.1 tryptophan synthase beta chain [Anaeromicropila populeti]